MSFGPGGDPGASFGLLNPLKWWKLGNGVGKIVPSSIVNSSLVFRNYLRCRRLKNTPKIINFLIISYLIHNLTKYLLCFAHSFRLTFRVYL